MATAPKKTATKTANKKAPAKKAPAKKAPAKKAPEKVVVLPTLPDTSARKVANNDNAATLGGVKGDFIAKALSDPMLAIGAAIAGDETAAPLALAVLATEANNALAKPSVVPVVTKATIANAAKERGFDKDAMTALNEMFGGTAKAAERVVASVAPYLFVIGKPDAGRELGAYSKATLEKIGSLVRNARLAASKETDAATRELLSGYDIEHALAVIDATLKEKAAKARAAIKADKVPTYMSQNDVRMFKDLNGRTPERAITYEGKADAAAQPAPNATPAQNATPALQSGTAQAQANAVQNDTAGPDDKKTGSGGQTDGAAPLEQAYLASLMSDLLSSMVANAELTDVGISLPTEKALQRKAGLIGRINGMLKRYNATSAKK